MYLISLNSISKSKNVKRKAVISNNLSIKVRWRSYFHFKVVDNKGVESQL